MGRPVLFALQPLGTGNVYRSLAIAEELRRLFKAIDPYFLVGEPAAELLRPVTDFECFPELTPIREPNGHQSLGIRQSDQVLRVARRLRPDLVVVDGLWSVPPKLRRAGIPAVFLTDDMKDHEDFGRWRQGLWNWMRRAVVTSTQLRYFLGEPSYLRTPELRNWARRYFRFSGPISGLARYQSDRSATLRDDLGVTQPLLLAVAAGSRPTSEASFATLLQALADWPHESQAKVFVCSGPTLHFSDLPRHWSAAAVTPELVQTIAASDLCVIPASLSLMAECGGLQKPTLVLPCKGDVWQHRMAEYFHHRHGLHWLPADQQTTANIQASLTALRQQAKSPHSQGGYEWQPIDEEAQRNSAYSIADMIAEQLGRRRPAVTTEQMQQRLRRQQS